MRRVLPLVALLGCHAQQVKFTGPVPVQVTAWPAKTPADYVQCFIPVQPDLPPEPTWDAQLDVWDRVTVHRRDYEALLEYVKKFDEWAADVAYCVEKIRTLGDRKP